MDCKQKNKQRVETEDDLQVIYPKKLSIPNKDYYHQEMQVKIDIDTYIQSDPQKWSTSMICISFQSSF